MDRLLDEAHALGGGAGAADQAGYIDAQVRAFGDDYVTLLGGVRARAGSARIIVLNVPNLAASPFEQIVVTDTIPLREGAPDNIKVLSVADLLTDTIRRIFTDDSVSEVFGGENQLF